MDTRLEKAIILGDLILIKKIVYSGEVQVTKEHFTICHTMKKLCIPDNSNNDSIFDNIESFLKQEYKPPVKYSLCARLFGI